MSEDIWCIQTPGGYSFGGSGVICTKADPAKVALMMMDGGRVTASSCCRRTMWAAATGWPGSTTA